MPNPWKKARAAALSRLVSGLGRPDRGASLVVQAGFPTSLADLVVKNRDRLKKPSRRKTHSSSLRVPAVAAGEDAGRPVVRSSRGGAGGILEESPCSPVPNSMEIKTNASGSGFGLLVVNLLVLMVLAIERRKLVAGITISAFALFLLDFMGLQVFKFLKPSSNARRSLNSTIGGILDLEGRERVSPIREVGVESHVDSMPSDRNWEESSIDSDQGREILSERRDLTVGRNVGSSGNSKGKKFWRKFVPKKSNGSRKYKDEKKLVQNSSSDLSRRGEIDSITEEDAVELINAKGDNKDSNEEVVSFIASNEVTNFDKEEIGYANREIILKTGSGGPQQFVFFVILLFGLAGGKAAAVILTVSWCLFIKLTETVCKK